MSGTLNAESGAEPVFPWNDAITLCGTDGGARAVVLSLSAVFDAIQALRADLRQIDGPGSAGQ